jgi:SOS-response transcriptional repressor LexA
MPTAMSTRVPVPIVPAKPALEGDCAGAEPFVLMVLGDAMAPEFVEGEIIVVEPEGHATDGSFVVAQVDGEWTLRQLARNGVHWQLCALNLAYPAQDLVDLAPSRRASKRYVD